MIITRRRLNAMCNINRWYGDTTRPFSIMEHTAIGAHVAVWFRWSPLAQRCWWLHDIHESEICGDVSTPDKSLYTGDDYTNAVREFDDLLGFEVDGMPMHWWEDPVIRIMDTMMRDVENDLIVVGKRQGVPAPNYNDPRQKMIRELITSGIYSGQRGVERYHLDCRIIGLPEVD